MYQAKVNIVDVRRGEFTIEDISDSDETIIERRVTLVDGRGHSNTYTFDLSNRITIKGLKQDMTYSIDYEAVPSNPQFNSQYTITSVFAVYSYSENLLLNLQEEIRCGRKGVCNDSEASKLIKLSSEVIYGLEAARYHIRKCNQMTTQTILDYLNDYIVQREGNKAVVKSGCGC